MSEPRQHVSLTTKLASALLEIGDVPREHAKLMSAEQIISLYQFDHTELHAFGGSIHFTNLKPTLILPHREKSKHDKSITAKADRLDKSAAEHRARLAVKAGAPTSDQFQRRKRKIQSRGFPKTYRPLRSRKFDQANRNER